MASSNWSDFVATPPNLASSSLADFVDAGRQPDDDFMLSQEQIRDIFPQAPCQSAPVAQPPQPPQPQTYGGPQYMPTYPTEFSEIENRTLTVTNVNPETTEEEIQDTFSPWESLRNIDYSALPQGSVTVEYYDLRHAQSAKRMINGTLLHGNVIVVAYAPLPKIEDPKKPPNNGTIVVFHLPMGITTPLIETQFGRFGDIRQVRGTPSKPTQRFIEYWDIRAAEQALKGLSGKLIMGSKVSIEFSLPGGFRRNVQRPEQGVNCTNPIRVQH